MGDTVTNPVTSSDTTVSALVVDPAGTPTAGDTAFVETADGYSFLVKVAGETFYNSDNPPVAFEIQSISGTTATVTNSVNPSTTADFSTQMTQAEFDANFNSSGTAGTLRPPEDVSGPNGVTNIVYGQNGSNGRDGALFVPPSSGGNGADGPTQNATLSSDVDATSNVGWSVGSVGGDGGDGGDSYLSFFSGRDGGDGGKGGTVNAVQSAGSTIQTSGSGNDGIFAFSRSGEAGDGGSGFAAPGGGTGGHSADGGAVTLDQRGTIFTQGENADGIYALSVSNNGGNGGDQWGLVGSAGDGGLGGSGGTVTVLSSGSILTQGDFANGILAQSVGGSGGSAGSAGNLLVSLLGANDNGGNGSTVSVSNSGAIQTGGAFARGIVAQSIGGGGGTGGSGGGLVALALGGVGSNGGNGGAVNVTNQGSGTIVTAREGADGILAQSIGGSGAAGANAYGLVAVGGTGSNGGSSSAVSVSNYGSITTEGVGARGIVAQSIGGGGGDGGSTGGMVAVGGSGSGGGSGAPVSVLNDGIITTKESDALGILAQSIGGGGGNGGSSGSVGAFVGVGIGGKGGGGGAGGDASVTLSNTDASQPSSIRTSGARSTGVFVQSVGGGGGNGGGAVSVAAGAFGAASVAVGGSAGSGGAGGTVTMTGSGSAAVQTGDEDSDGILLQSIGGGGGNGGYAVSVAVSGGPVSGSLSVGVGGSGGSGGAGGEVRVGTVDGLGALTGAGFTGSVITGADRSSGLVFQSVGGGGGNGGLAVSASGAGSVLFSGSISVGVGGSGATGGAGGRVRVFTDSSVATLGDYSTAYLAQSVGGGGGNGGGSVAAGISASGGGAASINVGVGGAASGGSSGGDVDLIAGGATIETGGNFAQGVVAQSIGGGGGNGGYSVAAGAGGAGAGAGAVSVGLGGSGGGGGNGGTVTARTEAAVTTNRDDSGGVLVQSVGGGGGNGGFSVAAGAAVGGAGAGTVTVGLGGSGGSGGLGGAVDGTVNGAVTTKGDRSSAVVVQSIGGGGGNGGFSVSGGISGAGVGSGSVAVGLGGSGGSGGNASSVDATVAGAVSTIGEDSTGILAQSVGGGGGNGGFNVAGTISGSGTGSGAVSVGLGGGGGSGATGGDVTLAASEAVTTGGDRSSAVVAQSIGGGGGNGGFNIAGSIAGAGTGSGSVSVGLGGNGGGGGDAGKVDVTADGAILTDGFAASGLVAQSIGGGGGNGGFDVSASVAVAGTGSGAVSVGLGGSGAGSGNGGEVVARTTNRVETRSDASTGILAQSVGGGGGNGGFNVSPALSAAGTGSGAIGVGIGGSGGGGGNGGQVTLTVEDGRGAAAIAAAPATVQTGGAQSAAVVAQSIGGGGGNGGLNVTPTGSGAGTGSGAIGVGIGGRGAGGGDGGAVASTVTADLATTGSESGGLLVQSVGGGGGNGGLNVSAAVSAAGTGSGGAAVGLGGAAGSGGAGGAVTSELTGDVATTGDNSAGVLVQSVGGGGGNGGVNVSAALSLAGDGSGAVGVGIGGSGGDGGDGGSASGAVTGDVTTTGDDSTGVTVQSLGGGGGNGGLTVSGAISIAGTGSGAAAIGVGGFGGGGGTAGDVDGSFDGILSTTGDRSAGVVAQSLGGGGGNGGTNISGAISLAPDFSGALGIGVGGFGGDGGAAGSVDHSVAGLVETAGEDSIGILTQSLGGGGGNGGTNISAALSLSRDVSAGIGIGVGGFGGLGADAGATTVSNVTGGVLTTGYRSGGIVTQSLGGGGGNGGTNVSAAVSLSQNNGGAIGLGLGGFGAGAGGGKSVSSTVRTTAAHDSIATQGAESIGVLAQSVGGAGGSGGLNVSGAVSLTGKSGAAIGLGVGGFGGGGGDAGPVTLDVAGTVDTRGDKSHGLMAQSLGGGGGVGGTNVSGSLSLTKPSGSDTILSISAGVGGFGGGGGNAGDVDLSYTGALTAIPRTVQAGGSLAVDAKSGADGLVAQSIGGGGGSGGTSVSAGLSISSKPGAGQTDASKSYAVLVGVGGFGGTGGDAGAVTVDVGAGSTIDAHGTGRSGILAQSVGGGGGNGGLNVSGGIVSDSSLIVGVGGFGGNAGTAGDVAVTARADIAVTTDPDDLVEPSTDSFETTLRNILGDDIVDAAEGLAESKGLKGLFTQLGLFDSEASETEGSAGLLAQSLGGGGGNGGLNVSGGVAIDKDGKIPSITFGIGGFGGAGNVSGGVTVDHAGAIDVAGNWKHGIFAQSVAGGGGNGALNVSGQLNWNGSKTSDGATDLSIVAGLGGHGGLGADAGDVAVTSDGDITATGYHARGLFAQSLGGGGGTGGVNVTAIGTKNSSPVGIGVGGFGAGGGDAGSVTVTRGSAAAAAGLITTDGVGANGIEASSIGGGGGDAGVNAVLGFSKAAGSKSDSGSSSDRKTPTHTGVDASVIANYNSVLDELEGKTNPTPAGGEKTSVSGLFAIGGSAGNAGNAGTVDIAHFGDVLTLDDSSHGVFGQSLGGGGGNAALNFGMIYQSGNSEQTKGFGLAVGGGTGDGGTGAAVTLDNVGAVVTTGADSHGIFAQSVGGGGGNAGYSSLTNAGEGGSVAIQIGRTGGTGGAAGAVHASSDGTVLTQGDRSHGLFAQSVGNGGGNSTATSVTLGTPKTSDDKGSSFKLSVGLEGGQGGAAGDVDVAATGALTTLGTDAHGVFAQSVGGGGGTGGGASGSAGAGKSLSISIGGTGGTGGTGGKVSVASTAGILTGADRSIGILAQSVGGAGGTGGYAKSGVTAMSFLKNTVKGSDIGTTASLSIGGSGGAGMASDQVDVVNQGTIGTYGGSAHGIFAQSVGGGGGKGGLVQNNIVNLRGSIGNQASISVGGTGGTGAVSGDVSVSNQGEIRTRSTKSAGIYAQAVGGGGGDAQNVTNIFLGTSADNTSNNAMLLGGTGGTGAAAGDVSVVNESGALIATLGSESHGVLAQSVGGGGGQGGNVISVSLSKPGAGAKQARGAQLAIGGTGGQGGTGGTVAVTNRGQITTTGGAAHGIVAQSVGGGGGIGGTSVIGTLSIKSGTEGDPSLGFALGGAGGSGNTGGAVTVRNAGAIAVSGDKAYGVLAQSVGGGGGDGGLAMSLSGNDLANRAAGKSYSKIAVGGAGGDGADGGDVVVRHSGTIAVGGDDAYGIFAQSVGGGGGSAGFSVSAPAAMALDYLFSTVLGAREGAKGTAGKVTVDSTGDIAMSGTNAQAILTQTVNGGGGNVDTFVDFGTFTSGTAATGTAPALAGSISLGGDDADQTAGSAVDATHSGNLSTQGDRSVASLTQSIGGGGGNGGAAFVLDPSSAIALDLNLGAKDTDDAGGGNVTLARTGSVATIGSQSQAVSVQSIGGGGGRLATDVSRGGASAQAKATAALVLGADPSFNNPGGDLDLDLGGETVTLGDYSPGLVLQSIGAGGGQSYLTGLTRAEVEIGASDGSSGDGGDITLANAGAVLAAGSRSDGIVLQSIGGGGGYVRTDLGAAALTVTASADNAGDGGDISLVQSGTVHAAGAGAIGILAQSLGGGGGLVDQVFRGSAGGDGSGGAIALTADGNVVADAAGGVAILAQSEGRNGGGRVTLGLDGVIKGGSGTGAAAIAVTGGSENRVDLGSNGFVFALNNVAITGSSGNDRIVSKAGVVGNIDLGGGRNRFTNAASGTLVTHETLDLGRDGLLTNAGLLVPGGDVVQSGLGASASRSDFTTTRNVPQTTTLVGSLLMTPTSRFQIDVSYRASGAAGDGSDLIRTTGSVTFDGLVEPTLLSLERLFPLTIIESGGTAVDKGATVHDTATIDYSIAIGSIELAATPDFSLPGMTGNQGAVGDHINAILTGDGSAALGPLFALIGNMTDAGEVADTLDRLTTEGYAANRVATLFSGLGFAAGIGDCERRKSREFDLARGECWWLETQGDRFEQDPFDGYRSLGIRSNSMIGGVERAIDDNWTAGFALGYESLDVTSGDNFSSDADRGHLGVSIFRRTGPLVLGAALTGSFGQFESTRYVGVSGTLPDGNAVSLVSAESTQTITQANLGLRAAYTLQNPGSRVYARPSIDLDASYIYASQADESGEAAFGMEVGSTSEWVLSMSPTVEVGGTFRSDAGALVHPFLRGGFTLFDTDRLEIDSAFIGAPESAGRFQNASGFDRLLGRVNAGLDIGSENSSSRVELGYYGVFSEHSTLHGLGVNWTMRF